MLGKLWIFQAALVISAEKCDQCDDTNVMLQSSARLQKDVNFDGSSTWTSPRDVAILRDPDQVTFQDGRYFHIFSAVPSFGDDGNFIALLMSQNSSKMLAHKRPMFCSGPNRSHLTQLRVKRRNLICDWPVKEKDQDRFEVFLEDDQGTRIGKVIAARNAAIAQGKFKTAMCVRDVYARGDRNETDFGEGVGRLLQWMEFNVQHGIEHFFVYTFRGTDEAVKDALMPYLNAGLATRIHSAVDPTGEPNAVGFHFDQVIRDCLYRAKSRATWVIPSFDNDEYFHLSTGRMFPNNKYKVPKDYMNTVWDAIVRSQKKSLNQVRSISFRKIRFAAPRSNEAVQISSPWRENATQQMMAHPGVEALPKYAFNVHVAWDAWWHGVWEPEPGTEDIKLDQSIGFVQHYRIPWGSQFTTATEKDETLRQDSKMLEAAIEARFGEKLNLLLRRLHQKRPNGM